MYPEWGYAGIPSVFEGKKFKLYSLSCEKSRKYVSVLPEIFFCLIRWKPAEDNDASALSVLCFPCENHTFPEAKT